jgi:hypothetical protein
LPIPFFYALNISQKLFLPGRKRQKNSLCSSGIKELQVVLFLIVSDTSGTLMQPDPATLSGGLTPLGAPALKKKGFQGGIVPTLPYPIPCSDLKKSGNASVPCNILLLN